MEYEYKTTFWMDFSIADRFGVSAVKDTYKRAFEGWKDNVEYFTELVMVLNHKIWEHWQNGNRKYAEVYDDLWRTAQSWGYENLKGEDLDYFWSVLD